MENNSNVIKKMASVLFGVATAIGISILIGGAFFKFIMKVCLVLDEFIFLEYLEQLTDFDSTFIAFSTVSGIICFILYFTITTAIKRKFGPNVLDMKYYIALVISILLFSYGAALYLDTKEEFGFILFYFLIAMWIVAGIINVLFLRVKKIRNSKLYKEQKQWHQKDM